METEAPARQTGVRPVVWPWLGLALALHLLVGLGLHYWAWQNAPTEPLPVLNAMLQAYDATSFHHQAMHFLDYWHGSPHLVLNLPGRYLGYPLILGGLYYLLGSFPLLGMALNSLAYLGGGWLAHGLALRLGQTPAQARNLALAVALWPPSLAYTSVLLKESLLILAVFGLLAALAALLQPGDGQGRRREAAAGLGLLAAVYLMVVLRPDLAGLALGTGLAGAAWALIRSWRAPRPGLWRSAAVCLLLVLAAWAGRDLAPFNFLTPPTPSREQAKPVAAEAKASPAAPADAPAGAGEIGRAHV
jgi:hypothetical protein